MVKLLYLPINCTDSVNMGLACLQSYLRSRGIESGLWDIHSPVYQLFRKYLPEYKTSLLEGLGITNPGQLIMSRLCFPEYHKQEPTAVEFARKQFGSAIDRIHDESGLIIRQMISDMHIRKGDIIGLSVSSCQLLAALFVSQEIRSRYPDVFIIAGGPFGTFTGGKRLLAAVKEWDAIALGEGERTLSTLAERLSSGRSINNIKGLVLRKDINSSKAASLPDQMSSEDLEAAPYPDFEGYSEKLLVTQAVGVETSRGCYWSKCRFCGLHACFSCRSEKSPSRVAAEIKHINEKYSCDSFWFTDLDMNSSTDRMIDVCDNIIAAGLDVNMMGMIRADNLSRKMFRKMAEAGFYRISIGFESFSQDLLEKMNKGAGVLDNLFAVKLGMEYRIKVGGNILINFPGETSGHVSETLKLINEQPQYFNRETLNEFSDYSDPQESGKYLRESAGLPSFPVHLLPPDMRFEIPFCDYILPEISPERLLRDHMWDHIRKLTGRQPAEELHSSYTANGDSVIVWLNSEMSGTKRIRLKDDAAKAMLLLKDPMFLSDIANKLSLTPEYASSLLSQMERSGLLYKEGDRYISLILPENLERKHASEACE
jgi:hypothetical protein